MSDYIERKELMLVLRDLRDVIDVALQRIASVSQNVTRVDAEIVKDNCHTFQNQELNRRFENEPLSNHPNDPIFNLNKKNEHRQEIAPGVYADRQLTTKEKQIEQRLIPMIQQIKDNPLLILEDDPFTK
jgi:hypothetical protein